MQHSCPNTFIYIYIYIYIYVLCIHCFVAGDAEGISSTGVWDSMSVRHAFIRKVLRLFRLIRI